MTTIELFFEAIQSRHQNKLESYIEENPKLVNTKDARGFTPLIFAAYFDNEDATKLLLENKAEIDAKDNTGNTALIGVCFKGNYHLAKLLIENGANINAINQLGTTPLIFATMYNRESVIKLLLEKGADTTIKDNDGKSAYQHALEKGFNNLLSLLETK